MIKRFLPYYKKHIKLLALDMFCATIVAGISLFYPMISRQIINDYVPNQKLNLILVWAGILLGISILKYFLNYIIGYYGHIMGVRMQGDMRKDIFKHLQKLPFSYFDEHKTGVIMSRIINDLMDISELAHHGPEDLFLSVMLLVGSFILMWSINIYITLIIFAFIPIIIVFGNIMRKRQRKAFRVSRVKVGEVNAILENSVSGVRVTKAFSNQAHEYEKFKEGNNEFIQSKYIAYKAMTVFHAGLTFMMDGIYLVAIVAGGLFFYNGIINIGDLTAYLIFVTLFTDPIKRLASFTEQFQRGASGFERFCELMDIDPERETGTSDIEIVNGDIEFKGVSFEYDEQSKVLSDLNFGIKGGETLALVGPSGGGKTTICHLIPRFYDLTSGAITVEGVNINNISRQSLRKHIGIVQQDVFVFTGTIYENILYGRLDATEQEVYEAAKQAQLYDYVMQLPDGFNTNIGERGVKLSGGQKQRISIARVFLKDPKILILDEATSALDNITESEIKQSLEQLTKGRTTVVVAHRLSTITGADNIVVLTDSGIAQMGNHTELLAAGGIYKDLYEASVANE